MRVGPMTATTPVGGPAAVAAGDDGDAGRAGRSSSFSPADADATGARRARLRGVVVGCAAARCCPRAPCMHGQRAIRIWLNSGLVRSELTPSRVRAREVASPGGMSSTSSSAMRTSGLRNASVHAAGRAPARSPRRIVLPSRASLRRRWTAARSSGTNLLGELDVAVRPRWPSSVTTATMSAAAATSDTSDELAGCCMLLHGGRQHDREAIGQTGKRGGSLLEQRVELAGRPAHLLGDLAVALVVSGRYGPIRSRSSTNAR